MHDLPKHLAEWLQHITDQLHAAHHGWSKDKQGFQRVYRAIAPTLDELFSVSLQARGKPSEGDPLQQLTPPLNTRGYTGVDAIKSGQKRRAARRAMRIIQQTTRQWEDLLADASASEQRVIWLGLMPTVARFEKALADLGELFPYGAAGWCAAYRRNFLRQTAAPDSPAHTSPNVRAEATRAAEQKESAAGDQRQELPGTDGHLPNDRNDSGNCHDQSN